MKTQYEIYMDFRAAIDQVQELRSIASSMESISNDQLQGTLNSVARNWQGENAEAYLTKAQGVRNKILLTAADIRKVADTIEEIAQRTYDAEIRAIEIAAKSGSAPFGEGGDGGSGVR